MHWVMYNIPAGSDGLAEGVAPEGTLVDGSTQGRNDFRRTGYGGPCPPGGTHRYYFKLYALDADLELEEGLTKPQLLDAMKGHVLAEAQLMGRYAP